MAYLNDFRKEYDIFIYRNVRKYILSLYGNKKNKAIVKSTF